MKGEILGVQGLRVIGNDNYVPHPKDRCSPEPDAVVSGSGGLRAHV
jgi:hypothetical protein